MRWERILVRMPGAKLGDYLMTTPALASLRRAYPAAKITLLLWPSQSGQWLTDRTLFDDYLQDDWRGSPGSIGGGYAICREIRARHFDAFVALGSSSRSAWLGRLAGIPVRIGSTSRSYRALYTKNVSQNRNCPDRHEVEYNHDLMRTLGVKDTPGPMQFAVTQEDSSEAVQMLRSARIRVGQPFVVVNPTCGGSSRNWRPEGFTQVVQGLIREAEIPVVLIGTPQDCDYNAHLARFVDAPVINFTGQTSVGVLAALLKRSALHLSVDTGTMHLAAAMQTPCVTVFPFMEHWEQRTRWRPWQTEYRLIGPCAKCSDCRPGRCRRTQDVCVRSVDTAEVLAASLSLLETAPVAVAAK